MKTVLAASAAALACAAGPALADPIAPGGSVVYSVPGTASIYQIFGHPGNTGGDYGPATDALLTTFAAGAGNVFVFNATGAINCCGGTPNAGPDGGGGAMSVGGANGLSSLTGNTSIPLVGVFTTNSDPFGGAAPATLNFDANNPTNLAPLLNQVFYIGDGRAGYNNAGGANLAFVAPTAATRLYIGVIDAYSFNGTTGYYNDNTGSFRVVAALVAQGGVPEPATWAMMLLGFGAIGGAMRYRRRVAACS
ncbi:MAG: PEPxxWA-CTERM sorting domain-containing protein [Proteobacteria bacterium]|nr:PEPxxWA-CTERM sorting domain-containing protein [Pseudomonadota bacterium]